MVTNKKKEEIITFKVDESLAKKLSGISNRSDFIRRAILSALESACPLCMGTGVLTPEQKEHWDEFSQTHTIGECSSCHAQYIICERH